jgi:glyoxylase-like metal-dependent hydrolase (beta-lactamase superfamily II)
VPVSATTRGSRVSSTEASEIVHPWVEPPAPGSALDVAPGVRWVRMPLPFALDHINLWLLEDEGGWAIVDTGIGLAETVELWERVFADELGGKGVTRVIVTHYHPDHMGNAGWLTERFRIDLWCAQAEWLTAQLAWRRRGGADVEQRISHYRRHGFGDEALEKFRQRGNHYPRVVPTLATEFHCLRDGDVLTIGGRRWEVLTVHGHAPEHACLWCPEAGVLIGGDQVLPKITTNVSVWPEQPYGNPLRLYLDSLMRFRPMPSDTLVLPSHGLPFQGLHARLDRLRQHHEARLAEAFDALGDPRTGVDLIPVLFRRELDVHQLNFAIGEVLAHLHLLEADGGVARSVDADGVHRFRRV